MACAETRNFARVRTPGWREEGRETGRGESDKRRAIPGR